MTDPPARVIRRCRLSSTHRPFSPERPEAEPPGSPLWTALAIPSGIPREQNQGHRFAGSIEGPIARRCRGERTTYKVCGGCHPRHGEARGPPPVDPAVHPQLLQEIGLPLPYGIDSQSTGRLTAVRRRVEDWSHGRRAATGWARLMKDDGDPAVNPSGACLLGRLCTK